MLTGVGAGEGKKNYTKFVPISYFRSNHINPSPLPPSYIRGSKYLKHNSSDQILARRLHGSILLHYFKSIRILGPFHASSDVTSYRLLCPYVLYIPTYMYVHTSVKNKLPLLPGKLTKRASEQISNSNVPSLFIFNLFVTPCIISSYVHM